MEDWEKERRIKLGKEWDKGEIKLPDYMNNVMWSKAKYIEFSIALETEFRKNNILDQKI